MWVQFSRPTYAQMQPGACGMESWRRGYRTSPWLCAMPAAMVLLPTRNLFDCLCRPTTCSVEACLEQHRTSIRVGAHLGGQQVVIKRCHCLAGHVLSRSQLWVRGGLALGAGGNSRQCLQWTKLLTSGNHVEAVSVLRCCLAGLFKEVVDVCLAQGVPLMAIVSDSQVSGS